MKKYIILLLTIVSLSCSDDEKASVLSYNVKNVSYIPTNGGAVLIFNLPDIENISYVQAKYEISTGETIYKTSSSFIDTLLIDGFLEEKEHDVFITSFDNENNQSEPIVLKVKPLISNVNLVSQQVEVVPSFSGLMVKWKNKLKKQISVYTMFNIGDREIMKVKTSTDTSDFYFINDLENKDYDISIKVEDEYANFSKTIKLGKRRPFVDYKIEKAGWKVVTDEELPADSGWKNGPLTMYEGRIEFLWDDIIDDARLLNLNYFHSGDIAYPFSYFIDLGRTVKASRIRVWQRDWDNQYYGGENVKKFQLWISKDKYNWIPTPAKTIIKPALEHEALTEARNGHHFILYPTDPKFTPEFRYIEYRALTPYKTHNRGCTSELTVYGLEQKDF
jgi:hypothetical protein